MEKIDGFYHTRTLCEVAYNIGLEECDEDLYGNKPSVIIQSYNAPSLKIFRNHTNAPLIYLGYYLYDLMTEEFVTWVKTFADGLAVQTAGIEDLKELFAQNKHLKHEFVVYEYTLGFDVESYMNSINSGIVNGLFTDDSNTARVIQETLDYISDNDVRIISGWMMYVAYGVVIVCGAIVLCSRWKWFRNLFVGTKVESIEHHMVNEELKGLTDK